MDLNWFDDANCKGVDKNVFFLEGNVPPLESRQRVAEAKSYCDACSVKKQCLEFALEYKEKHGIYGGATPQERMAMRGYGKLVRR
jgi:WhiB family redox-sensing transcriptional regulator